MDDQHAVFVNGTVSTTGTGTKASPYKTIGEAIKAAGTKLILVCDTTYDEQLTLTSAVKLFGGFACSDWAYEAGKRAVVKPKKGVALDISGVTATVLIEDLEFASADASAAGESSVAATIATSSDVKLRRVKLVAGKGQAGANGAVSPYTYPAQSTLNGKSASGLTGGGVAQCACPAGDQSIGGGGGNGPTPQDGNPGLPSLGGGQGGKAGAPTDCGSGGTGKNGAAASPPAPAPGASTLGTLTNTTWSPTKAPNASPGGPGQGGGGGASSASGGGGGGGCGGCGGAGGPGGGGGGASIALVAVGSTVTVDAGSELVTADAGNGGSGAAGQAGQTSGGNGGLPDVSGGCQGGSGGKGADGGAGGGGAGGISVAVLWKGTQPALDGSAKLTLGKKGNKGAGGKPGSNDGVDGVAQNAFEVK